jgi:hypothetical protein
MIARLRVATRDDIQHLESSGTDQDRGEHASPSAACRRSRMGRAAISASLVAGIDSVGRWHAGLPTYLTESVVYSRRYDADCETWSTAT